MVPINNYKFVGEIGEGGMGKVYRYTHVRLNRDVAIKFLQPELSGREDIVERFNSEAIVQGQMSHANIATVYEFDQINDLFYIAMEFVRGETLASILARETALPWQTAVQYAVGILDGLEHAHSFNIVHRDIKPSNLMVTDQKTVKILDFGIAKTLDASDISRLTRVGHAIGTTEYMSPEQYRGEVIDARSDIYAVGLVLYEMLTGQIPFITKITQSPRVFSQKIPEELAQLVLKALEKIPENRFSSAGEFSEKLRNQLGATPISPIVSILPILPNLGWIKPVKHFYSDYPYVVFSSVLLLVAFTIRYIPPTVNPVEKPEYVIEKIPPDKQSTPAIALALPEITAPIPPKVSVPMPTRPQPPVFPRNPTSTTEIKPTNINKTPPTVPKDIANQPSNPRSHADNSPPKDIKNGGRRNRVNPATQSREGKPGGVTRRSTEVKPPRNIPNRAPHHNHHPRKPTGLDKYTREMILRLRYR